MVIIGAVAGLSCYVGGYFAGRRDERKWNMFLYQYGYFYGRRDERRKHR